jgi:predicted nucleic acid-binding protein
MPELAISNTSPIQYLYQLGLIHLLPRFYQKVAIPQAVADELSTGRSLEVELPDLPALGWLEVRPSVQAQPLPLATTLGIGERQVLALAIGVANSLVILDDGRARRIGRLLGLKMTGTVGILARGTREGLNPRLLSMLDRLESLGFRLSTDVKAAALRRVGEGY